jgi:hypothetical protein
MALHITSSFAFAMLLTAGLGRQGEEALRVAPPRHGERVLANG